MHRRSDGDTGVGDLVRTWHRLVCHALAEVVVEGWRRRGMEVNRGIKRDFK